VTTGLFVSLLLQKQLQLKGAQFSGVSVRSGDDVSQELIVDASVHDDGDKYKNNPFLHLVSEIGIIVVTALFLMGHEQLLTLVACRLVANGVKSSAVTK
jgi:hypothetical protein